MGLVKLSRGQCDTIKRRLTDEKLFLLLRGVVIFLERNRVTDVIANIIEGCVSEMSQINLPNGNKNNKYFHHNKLADF